MMALLYTLLTLTLMGVSVFLVFAGNTGGVMRKNYNYQVRTNTMNACLVYGDTLVRGGGLAANSPPIPSKVTVAAGCLAQDTSGCGEPITCTIEMKIDNKIYVTVDQ